MKFTPRPRPTGEAARAVWKIYDLPLNPDSGIGTKHNDNDGMDWALGRRRSWASFRTTAAWDSTATYYTVNNPNRLVTIGKQSTANRNCFVSQGGRAKRRGSHRSRLDARRARELLFDVNPGRRGLGKLDPKTKDHHKPPRT